MAIVIAAVLVIVTIMKPVLTGGGNIAAFPKNKIGSEKTTIKEIQGVTAISQMPELPSGCEVTALTMILNWAGANVDKQDVAKAIPKGKAPTLKNGFLSGDNPNEVFIGSPYSTGVFGVYHRPIALLMDKYLPGQAVDITGVEFERLLETIDSGRPVIVWATINMAEPKENLAWYDNKGKKVTWIGPEHTYLLIGYSDTDVIVNDPYTGKRVSYPMDLFKNRWDALGRQAVTVSSKITGNVVTTILAK